MPTSQIRYQFRMPSDLGPLYLVVAEAGVAGLYWKEQAISYLPDLRGADPAARWLNPAIRQVEEYLGGARTAFDLPLVLAGTDFQRAVWEELRRIPYGATLSYRELAQRVGRERAVRAVGTANGRNPISILIPCHRVIGADGSLRGYAGTPAIKSRLLALESRAPRN